MTRLRLLACAALASASLPPRQRSALLSTRRQVAGETAAVLPFQPEGTGQHGQRVEEDPGRAKDHSKHGHGHVHEHQDHEWRTWDQGFLFTGVLFVLLAGAAVTSRKARMDGLVCRTLTGKKQLPEVARENLSPAAVVALVSMAKSLALGIASGAGPMTGIATAIVGSLAGGLFCSSAFTVLGPAGALAGILMRYSLIYGSEVLPWLSMLSAVLVGFTLLFRLHDFCKFMPKSVFEGFSLGVAISIAFGQMDYAFGLHSGAPRHIRGLELSPVVLRIFASMEAIESAQPASVVIFTVGTILMLYLYKTFPKSKGGTPIAWTLPFVALMVVFGMLCDEDALGQIPLELDTLKSKYGMDRAWFARPLTPLAEIIDKAADHGGDYMDIVGGAVSIAFVAILETLIAARIAAAQTGMAFDVEQELQGLALAQFSCGICGLMPPAGLFVFTHMNRSAGSTHKTSQFLVGAFMMFLAVFLMYILSFLPLCAVAAVLVVACLKMVPISYVQHLYRYHCPSFCLLLVVAFLSFAVASEVGLLFGAVIAIMGSVKETGRSHANLAVNMSNGRKTASGVPKMMSIDAIQLDNLDEALAEGEDTDVVSSRVSRAFDDDSSNSSLMELKDKRTGVLDYFALGYNYQDLYYQLENQQKPQKSSSTSSKRLIMEQRGRRIYLYTFLGQLDFLTAESHAERIARILETRPQVLVLDLKNVPWLDPDGLDALEAVLRVCTQLEVTFFVAGARQAVKSEMQIYDWYKGVRMFENSDEALQHAAKEDMSSGSLTPSTGKERAISNAV